MAYIRLNNHFSVILFWCHVSVAANGFQKFAISLLKTKFLPNFNNTALLCKSNSGDPRNFNILPHHSCNHFPFYWWGGVIGQFSLVFALPRLLSFNFPFSQINIRYKNKLIDAVSVLGWYDIGFVGFVRLFVCQVNWSKSSKPHVNFCIKSLGKF